MLPIAVERRAQAREELGRSRRRYPRLRVKLDAFYESETCFLSFDEAELSLRGVFLPCRTGDPEGAEGVVRLALPGSVEMLKAGVVVLRRPEVGRPGMALRFTELSDAARARLAAYLLRAGGLGQLPQLDARFPGWARLDHPLLRRERRSAGRG